MRIPHLGQANVGHEPPRRIDPVPEHAVSTSDPVMQPYRGFEDHGVPTTNVPHPTAQETGTVAAHYTAPAHEPDPIPVRVVTEGGREYRKFTAYAQTVNANPCAIASRNIDRSAVTIKNNSAVPIWLSDNNMVKPRNGFELAAGDSVTWNVHAPVYGVTDDGTEQLVSVAQFFAIPLDASRSVQPGT